MLTAFSSFVGFPTIPQRLSYSLLFTLCLCSYPVAVFPEQKQTVTVTWPLGGADTGTTRSVWTSAPVSQHSKVHPQHQFSSMLNRYPKRKWKIVIDCKCISCMMTCMDASVENLWWLVHFGAALLRKCDEEMFQYILLQFLPSLSELTNWFIRKGET